MNYRVLGTTNLRVSEVSFGCMSLGEDQAENTTLLRKAFENGINLFDTADLYQHGQNEVFVGKALHDIRRKVLIATKVGNQWRQDGSGWDWNPSKAYILEAVEASLTRLRTDYIDLYQLHGGTIDDPIDETIEAFEILKQQGKIRHYGISSIRPNVIREYVSRSQIVSVMMQYSLLDRRPEESCLGLLQQHRIGVLARGSLAKGVLAGKPPASYLQYSQHDIHLAAEAINACANAQRSPGQTALRFALHHPAITTAVVGIRTMRQLDDCLEIVTAPVLTNEEMAMLRGLLPPNIYDVHR